VGLVVHPNLRGWKRNKIGSKTDCVACAKDSTGYRGHRIPGFIQSSAVAFGSCGHRIHRAAPQWQVLWSPDSGATCVYCDWMGWRIVLDVDAHSGHSHPVPLKTHPASASSALLS